MATLPAQSNISPAMAEFNGSLYIAWSDTFELHTTWSPPGQDWPNENPPDGTKWQTGPLLGEFTYSNPALCVFHGRLYIAWTGTDEYRLLNVKSTSDGATFDHKFTLPHDNSPWGPALAVFNDRLFLAWAGVDPQHQLNIISSPDGFTFDEKDKRILGQASVAAPALIGDDRDLLFFNEMILAWTTPDGAIHMANSSDGYDFDFTGPSVGSDRSSAGPVLVTDGHEVAYIAWIDAAHTGDGAGRIVYMYNRGDLGRGQWFVNRTVLPDSSPAAPAISKLHIWGGQTPIVAAYVRGDNHHLNVVTMLP